MKTWIYTTLATFFGPQQGAARLYSFLKNKGHDISLKDLNQESYFSLLSPEFLGPVMDLMKVNIDSITRNGFLRRDVASILLNSSNDAIRQLVVKGMLAHKAPTSFPAVNDVLRKSLFGLVSSRINSDNLYYALLNEQDFVIAEIDKARKTLYQEFYRLPTQEFLKNFYTLLCGKALIDAAYFPAQLDFGLGFSGTAFGPKADDILRAIQDEQHNFLLPYYRQKVVPDLMKEPPEVVGISITHMSEFISAFTLAHLIKLAHPEIHIVLGGSCVSEVSDRIARNKSLWEWFDSLVIGPGEYALSELVERLESKTDLSGVPNLIYKDRGEIKKSTRLVEFDINDACTPEYESLRPKSLLPLETTSGCYWGKCIFCFYPRQGTAGCSPEYEKKRIRNIELVLGDVAKLKEMYDPVAIGFTDSAMHPKRIEQIAEQNLKSQNKIKFFTFMRFEKEFKSEAFCNKLAEGGFMGGQAGLESGSQRVNDIIEKGIPLSDAVQIIGNFNKTGLLLHVYSIVGVPGETRKEAEMTYKFFKTWHSKLKLDWQIYPLYILEQSPLRQRTQEFGLQVFPLPDDYLIDSMGYQVENGLSQEESMGLAISFNEKLKRYAHPLNQIMDIESLKLFLFAQMAKGTPPGKVKNRLKGL